MFGAVWDYYSSKQKDKQYKQNTSPIRYKTEIIILANPELAWSGFEQPGPDDQSKLEVNTCAWDKKARENAFERVRIGFRCTSDWIKNWHEFFKPIEKRRNTKTKQITFDTQKKTGLKCMVTKNCGQLNKNLLNNNLFKVLTNIRCEQLADMK